MTDGAAWHGKHIGYTNHKCRCVECKAAHALFFRRYRQAKAMTGKCEDCIQPRVEGFKRCEKHLASARARCLRYAARKRAAGQSS